MKVVLTGWMFRKLKSVRAACVWHGKWEKWMKTKDTHDWPSFKGQIDKIDFLSHVPQSRVLTSFPRKKITNRTSLRKHRQSLSVIPGCVRCLLKMLMLQFPPRVRLLTISRVFCDFKRTGNVERLKPQRAAFAVNFYCLSMLAFRTPMHSSDFNSWKTPSTRTIPFRNLVGLWQANQAKLKLNGRSECEAKRFAFVYSQSGRAGNCETHSDSLLALFGLINLHFCIVFIVSP